MNAQPSGLSHQALGTCGLLGSRKPGRASLISLYNKLNGVETHTSAALVRYSAAELRPLIAQLDGERSPWLPGYRVKILDGNCIEARERRRKVLREVQAGALPGKSLVVYAPMAGLVSDVFPCADGHAQERSMLGQVLETVQAPDLWIQDRNFCTGVGKEPCKIPDSRWREKSSSTTTLMESQRGNTLHDSFLDLTFL